MTGLLWAQATPPRILCWYLPPIIAVVCLVYSATRHEQWSLILRRAVRLACWISGFMVLIQVLLWGVHLL